MTRVRRLSHHLLTGYPIDVPIQHKILGPFQDHHFVPKVKYPSRRSFYRLSWSHRFNMESLSRFGLTIVKDGMGSCLTLQGQEGMYIRKVTAKKRSK